MRYQEWRADQSSKRARGFDQGKTGRIQCFFSANQTSEFAGISVIKRMGYNSRNICSHAPRANTKFEAVRKTVPFFSEEASPQRATMATTATPVAASAPMSMSGVDQSVARRGMINTWITATTGHRLDTGGDKASGHALSRTPQRYFP
jgi:hypothetical protein